MTELKYLIDIISNNLIYININKCFFDTLKEEPTIYLERININEENYESI